MVKPTLKELIEAAENEVNVEDWYRQKMLLEKFKGMSKSTLDGFCKEMLDIQDFAEGIIKPGHSTTFIHYPTFLWFLRWKEANKYLVKKIPPEEVLKKCG
ncbi:hypothetical protein [Candidatus Enterococcus ferrettii]|uniref:Excisionase n=1 Tax=Candidatus Enterococcus ferrettii TaxID=2815324 RepID=A0ABV0EWB2_9ENTE|nr:hypothetical protein [Enterococcus sp. 665A]MBO1342118.1 hypothetical protein [Enterococcus sp. 665A]